MKIAIPVDIQSGDGSVYTSFGRAPYYAFYYTKTKELEFMKNPAASSPGGAGIQASQWLINQKVEAIVSPRIGENAQRVLQSANIIIYESIPGSIYENMEALANKKLKALDTAHPGFHRSAS